MKVSSAEESAAMITSVLSGTPGTPRTAAVLNAAAALYVSGTVDTLADGARKAEQLIDSNTAAKHLETIIAAG